MFRQSNSMFPRGRLFLLPVLETATALQRVTHLNRNEYSTEMEHAVWKNADVLNGLAGFVEQDFLFFGGVSRAWRSAWGNRPAETIAMAAHTTVAQLLDSLECGLHLAAKLCADAAGLGRRVLQRKGMVIAVENGSR